MNIFGIYFQLIVIFLPDKQYKHDDIWEQSEEVGSFSRTFDTFCDDYEDN